MKNDREDEKKVETISIPYIHKKIRFSDLKPPSATGKLLSDKDIRTIKSHSSKLPDGVVTDFIKKDQYIEKGQDIDIIKNGDKYYAVYGVMERSRYADEEKSLGIGTFGSAHLMQDLDTGEWFVIKRQMPNPELLDDKDFATFVGRENAALHKMDELIFQHNPNNENLNPNNENLPFLSGMHLAQGTELQAGVIIPKRQFAAVRWFDMALFGLKDLQRIHSLHLVHRDIKGANMILDPATRMIKHVDLGLAAPTDTEADGNFKDTHFSGTRLYMAPELKKQCKEKNANPDAKVEFKYNEKTDIYAMGMVLKEMFGFRNYGDRFTFSFECHKRIPDPEIRKEIEQILNLMTDSDPKKRPTLDYVIKRFEAMQQNLLRAPALLNRVVAVDIEEHKALFDALIPFADAEQEVKTLKRQLMECENLKHMGMGLQDDKIERLRRDLNIAKADLERATAKFRPFAEQMDSLKKADEIWLVAPTGTKPAELVKIKRALESSGMIVNSQAISCPSKANINTLVQSYANQREVAENNIYIPAHLKRDGTLESRLQVSGRHFDKIIAELEKDCGRIKNRKTKKQDDDLKVQKIQNCIKTLKGLAAEQRTYANIDMKFNELQQNLCVNKKIIGKLESMTGIFKSPTRERVAKLRKETKKIQEEGEQKKKGLSR